MGSSPAKASQPVANGAANGASNQENGVLKVERASTTREPTKLGLMREPTKFRREGTTIMLPNPNPPKKRKKDVFDVNKFVELDKRASKMSVELLYTTYTNVASYLTDDCDTEVAKVRALFTWMTSVDVGKYATTLEKLPETGTPLDYLLKIHWQMGNHAYFFHMLARAANLQSFIVSGVNKSAAYELGSKMDVEVHGAHWNAICVDGEWRLFDVFWASTCVVGRKSVEWTLFDRPEDEGGHDEGETKHVVNEFFFLPDADELIWTHFPTDERWQLLAKPLTMEQFEQAVYMRERFSDLGMSMIEGTSYKECIIKTVNGEITLEFALPKRKPIELKNHEFRFLLFRQRAKEGASTKAATHPLERYVYFRKTKEKISYRVSLPVAGRYKMDIFGRHAKTHDTFDLLCSYLIDCDQAKARLEALPDNPDIGWGPGIECEALGIKSATHNGGEITTEDGNVEIRFNTDNPTAVLQTLMSNELEEWILKRYAMVRTVGNEIIINLRLPRKGTYALNLFANVAKMSATKEFENICNYLLECTGDKVKNAPFPKLHSGVVGDTLIAKELGVKCKTKDTGMLTTDTGKVNVDFELKDDDIELFCEIRRADGTTEDVTVIKNVGSKSCNFDVSLARSGEYSMNVFAARKSDPNRVYHVHTSLINATQGTSEDANSKKNASAVTADAKTLASAGQDEAVPVKVLSVPGDSAMFSLPSSKDGRLVAEFQKISAIADIDNRLKKKMNDNGDDVFQIEVNESGEYVVNVFEQKGDGEVKLVGTYILVKDETQKSNNDSKLTSNNSKTASTENEANNSITQDNGQLDPKDAKKKKVPTATLR